MGSANILLKSFKGFKLCLNLLTTCILENLVLEYDEEHRISLIELIKKIKGYKFKLFRAKQEIHLGKYLKNFRLLKMGIINIIEILEKYDSRYTFEIYIDEIYNELIILTSNSTLESKINDIKNDIQRFYLQNINVL